MSDIDEKFASELQSLRQSGLLGERGRLRSLFDYLASRGPHAEDSPSEQVLAAEVFGRRDFSSGDDSSVRVYVHRLRKKLDDYYDKASDDKDCRLTLPRGEYRLTLGTLSRSRPHTRQLDRRMAAYVALALVVLNLLLWSLFVVTDDKPSGDTLNPVWQQLAQSPRPITVLVGDYYLFAEPTANGIERLIRDFGVNSANDLERLARSSPEQYGNAIDVGLSYLPPSAAYALGDLIPQLERTGRPFRVAPVSSSNINLLKSSNVIYIGLLSSMGFLESVAFANASFVPGKTYDELINMDTGEEFHSTEAMGLVENTAYRDYGYFSFIRLDTSGWLMVIAGTRDTGLRGTAELLAAPELAADFDQISERRRFEALVEIGGQQQANIRQTILSTH